MKAMCYNRVACIFTSRVNGTRGVYPLALSNGLRHSLLEGVCSKMMKFSNFVAKENCKASSKDSHT